MTETEINVAIAEACDRRVCKHHPDKWERRGPEGDSELYCPECKKYLSDMRVPDYLHDLNAMREAEEALEPQEHILYTLYLSEGIVDPSKPMDLYFLLHKSAPERVRAFLRVKGKWKE